MASQSPSTASWADAWLAAISAFSQPGRMRRGERFARRGRIRRFEVKPGEISAIVPEDDQSYQVLIKLEQLDDATWEQIVAHLASQALFSARLLAGEMPPQVIEVFSELGAPLFPDAKSLQASCTCPDWEVPCKHIAALYYLLADKFEENPFLLFLARGRSKEQLLGQLRQHRQAMTEGEEGAAESEVVAPAPPLDEVLDAFYDIGPAMAEATFHIAAPNAAMPHLRRLGPPPFSQVDLESILSPIYQTITDKALARAFKDES